MLLAHDEIEAVIVIYSWASFFQIKKDKNLFWAFRKVDAI